MHDSIWMFSNTVNEGDICIQIPMEFHHWMNLGNEEHNPMHMCTEVVLHGTSSQETAYDCKPQYSIVVGNLWPSRYFGATSPIGADHCQCLLGLMGVGT